MKKTIGVVVLFVVLLFSFSSFSFAKTSSTKAQYGSLKIFATPNSSKIYINGGLKGVGSVSKEKITVGSHLVQAKNDAGEVLFEELAVVKVGEQTIVIAKAPVVVPVVIVPPTPEVKPVIVEPTPPVVAAPVQPQKSPYVIGVDSTYGLTQLFINDRHFYSSPDTIKTAGLYLKRNFTNDLYAKCAVNYVFPGDGESESLGTVIAIDAGGQYGFIEASLGVNYLFSTYSAFGPVLQGGIGYQAFLGCKLGNAAIGAKYYVINGTVADSPDTYRMMFSSLCLGISVDLWK